MPKLSRVVLWSRCTPATNSALEWISDYIQLPRATIIEALLTDRLGGNHVHAHTVARAILAYKRSAAFPSRREIAADLATE